MSCMNYKRLTLLCGHYGSGKTNVAVNMALELQKQQGNVTVADLDIVNPYFRTKDSVAEFDAAGIKLICSEYANTNLDLPALPPELYSITDDKSRSVIVDVGGDDSGAVVLGRLAKAITAENDYDMFMVVNKYRPLTPDAVSTVEVIREIETASHLSFTGIVNNSNLGEETRPEDVLDSLGYADEISRLTGKPVVATTVKEELAEDLKGKISNLFPLKLQSKIIKA